MDDPDTVMSHNFVIFLIHNNNDRSKILLEEFYKATSMLNLHDKQDPDTQRDLALSILDMTLPNNLAFMNNHIKIGLTNFPDFVMLTKNEKQLFRFQLNDEMIE
jgi:hypothetical protein